MLLKLPPRSCREIEEVVSELVQGAISANNMVNLKSHIKHSTALQDIYEKEPTEGVCDFACICAHHARMQRHSNLTQQQWRHRALASDLACSAATKTLLGTEIHSCQCNAVLHAPAKRTMHPPNEQVHAALQRATRDCRMHASALRTCGRWCSSRPCPVGRRSPRSHPAGRWGPSQKTPAPAPAQCDPLSCL